MAEHDQRFKVLLREFLPDFLRLFFEAYLQLNEGKQQQFEQLLHHEPYKERD